jgi:hypothetical protein
MFTAREISKELGEDVAIVRQVLSGIDQAAIFAAEQARVSVEVWDGASDIQGIPAAHWKSNGDLPVGGHMYYCGKSPPGWCCERNHMPLVASGARQ